MDNAISIGKATLAAGVLVYLFLYLPLLIVVAYSFSASAAHGPWAGFSLSGYEQLFQDQVLADAAISSVVIALFASLVSAMLGTLAALASQRRKSRLLSVLIRAPLAIPELVIGASLLVFFVALNLTLGRVSIMLAHLVFCTSVVAILVRSRLAGIDVNLVEAARDLGATPSRAFWQVTFPLIRPRIIAGTLMAFALSINDFVIAFFTAGAGAATVPLQIYAALKSGTSPQINAIASVLLLLTLILFVIANKIAPGLWRGNSPSTRGG